MAEVDTRPRERLIEPLVEELRGVFSFGVSPLYENGQPALVVGGSAALWLHGLEIAAPNDIDLFVSGRVYGLLERAGWQERHAEPDGTPSLRWEPEMVVQPVSACAEWPWRSHPDQLAHIFNSAVPGPHGLALQSLDSLLLLKRGLLLRHAMSDVPAWHRGYKIRKDAVHAAEIEKALARDVPEFLTLGHLDPYALRKKLDEIGPPGWYLRPALDDGMDWIVVWPGGSTTRVIVP